MGGPSHSTSRTTYATIFATTQSSQPSSICGDTTSMPRPPKKGCKLGLKEVWEEKNLMQEGPHLLLKEIILLVNCHIYQAVLPHLLSLLEETKGLQLVLVFTLIIQLELKYLILVQQVRRFYMGQQN
ncbi:hypothetical protein MTR67_034045 [Solanum verrucosum]|uniref:Uncharacterized protein n=1 Tax=Solanum verrucosum TaxID=315347 RepID=A0AAF0U711_SOLVR|nr:hypothetical protein MTR67_034045 [Solanum verrucosum]